MSGMTGASMLRTRRKDVNVKPNRKLDRKSSRGMLYENEELRLRTININAEIERGQSDIKKLKRENEQLKREISALRYEYDRLDRLLRERRSSPEHSDDSASMCNACPECTSVDGSARAVAFHDLTVVPEEGEQENKSGTASPCECEDCQKEEKSCYSNDNKDKLVDSNQKTENQPVTKQPTQSQSNTHLQPNTEDNENERTVDVLVHDAPNMPSFFQSVTSHPVHFPGPPPPGFVMAPYQAPRFPTGGNVEDLLGDVQHSQTTIHTTYIQQNSVFMCNTQKILQKHCCCQKQDEKQETDEQPKCYVTEKNIELTYDYPRATPVASSPSPKSSDDVQTTTTEVASTVVFVEKRIPIKPKKFDFFFRSRSAPVGDNEEPIYATVNKLPKRLRRMELANLEKEVAYKSGDTNSSRTEIQKTDSEQAQPPDDDTSRSEKEKPIIQRPESPKAKKRKRFSLTFKKRERKKRDKKKELKNGTKNGVPLQVESDNERLIEEQEQKHKTCTRHRARNTTSSASSCPRYKRDSYQEMTTSHSEVERTNSVCSSVNSLASACTHKSRKLSAVPQNDSIPWCGCWGAGCV
ncbi:uncharacterized protein LOC126970084 isoform X2 [Leptidea sinapis]|nr:uncharacterized protein LOC126970084 isoform X2 [Leptidea sinapis]XP_050671755.1 uncharacterized protein LOC126970084 isoform X2 [Leptidea sinapis]XP_050671756.1 uncharacterized protein LOC126970084 isoform X2 [Leptidea sinapis]